MRAAVITEPGRVRLTTVADPVCGKHEVVVRMHATGVCGTDLALFHGVRPPPRWPWTPGHEGVGEIVAVGSAVTDRTEGQRVAIEPDYCCFDCAACRGGHTSSCVNRISAGVTHPGVLADYVNVPAAFAWPLADRVRLADAVCIEPLSVASAAVRRSGVRSAEHCLVIGVGSQGLLLCQALLALGSTPFVVDPDEGRLELAQRIGAQRLPADGVVDYVFDMSGAPDALTPVLHRVRNHGVVVVVGMHGQPPGITTAELVRRQLTVTGSFIYDHPGDFATTVRLVESGRISPCEVLGARYPFTDAHEAFTRAGDVAGKSWIGILQDRTFAADTSPTSRGTSM